MNDIWDYEKIDYLYHHYGIDDYRNICEKLNVTKSSLFNEAGKLAMYPKGEFTCEETRILKQYGKTLGNAVVFLLENRTIPEVEKELAAYV